MSFTEAARTIAARDAAATVAALTDQTDAYQRLAAAELAGDHTMASALRRAIAEKWPVRRPVDYVKKLTEANGKLEQIFRGAWLDRSARDLRDDLAHHRITPEYFTPRYTVLSAGWATAMGKILDEGTALLTRASEYLAQQVTRLTTAPAGDVAEQTLFEIRGQREWDRLRPQLENIPDTSLIGHLVAIIPTTTSAVTRKMYVDELPAYLNSRGLRVPENFIEDLIVESDPMAIAADNAETRASEFVQVLRYNVEKLTGLLSVEAQAELARMSSPDIDKLFAGGNPRFITVDQAGLQSA